MESRYFKVKNESIWNLQCISKYIFHEMFKYKKYIMVSLSYILHMVKPKRMTLPAIFQWLSRESFIMSV